MSFFRKTVIFLLILCAIQIAAGLVYAQTSPTPEAVAAREKELKAELAKTEAEIRQWTDVLNKKRAETGSFQRDAAILQAKIAQAKLIIKAKALAIQALGKDISKKQETINELNSRIDRGKESLAQIVRKTNEIDSFSLVEVALSNQNISDFFVDLDSYDSVNRSMEDLFDQIRTDKNLNESEKTALTSRKNQETDAKVAIETEKSTVEKTEAQKQELIRANKTQEKSYEQIVSDRQAKAAKIRSALFALRDAAAIPFGQALTYANEVSKRTGVRPAFLLAILTQESNLGVNIGQCYVTNLKTGDGAGKNTGTPFKGVMHPTRDVPPFVALAQKLGFEPTTRPVSCPQPGGYGGAMGPSQFIPSTWALYVGRVSAALGSPGTTPSPWDPEAAFMASGIFLADLGAGAGGYSAEYQAAGRYYAGAGWATRGAAYANSVLKHATDIQTNMIDPLQGL